MFIAAAMASPIGGPGGQVCRTARLMFIAAAVIQSWICTRALPLKRVRRGPCSSLARPKVPSTRTWRSRSRRLPSGLAVRSLAAINPAELQRGIDRILRELWRLGRQGEKLTEDAG
jgi:hypothetical protein